MTPRPFLKGVLAQAALFEGFANSDPSLCSPPAASPNGGSTTERTQLHERYADRLKINSGLTRQLVSFQGNRQRPGLRWFKYKEAFSQALVESYLDRFKPRSLLDPFSGAGTAPLVAAGRGISSVGIDVSPVGTFAANAVSVAANKVEKADFSDLAQKILDALDRNTPPPQEHYFPHLPITEMAFPKDTERDLATARSFLADTKSGEPDIAVMLEAACVSVLETVSYTSKDGQFLRWDSRSPRQSKSRMTKGRIPSLKEALTIKFAEMEADCDAVKRAFGRTEPEFITGSSLDVLVELEAGTTDLVLTSPPYANRYNYPRIYALELAWLGYSNADFADLREAMITATVENRTKTEWLEACYGHTDTYSCAVAAYEGQAALWEVLDILSAHQDNLSNPHIVRLVEGYFLELAVIISQLGRVVQPGGHVVMVNDNVQYHGEEIPVDLILSDIAEHCGFECLAIEVLPKGKGNASQQMGRYGRREIRKCVYTWQRV